MWMKGQEHYTVHRWTNPNLQHLVDWNNQVTDETVQAYREQIGQEFKKVRKAKRWTQKQLSELSGIPAQRISRIENGREDTPPEQLLSLAATLGKKLTLRLEDAD